MLAASDADAEEERVGAEISRSSSQVVFCLNVESRVVRLSVRGKGRSLTRLGVTGLGRVAGTSLYDRGRESTDVTSACFLDSGGVGHLYDLGDKEREKHR